MISADEALKIILENTPVLAAEEAPLADAVERVLAEDLIAREDLPPFDNSAMDGYAVKIPGEPAPFTFGLREVVRAGALAGGPLNSGEAVKIMTGAPVPEGTEAVVMRELTEVPSEGRVRILQAPKPGDNIRRRGEDVRAGDLLLKKSVSIRPYEVGLLAAQGYRAVPVVCQPRVAVLSTGDELVGVDQRPGPGQIRGSNGPALAAAVSRWGAVPVFQGIVKDDPGLLRPVFQRALESANALLVSGGVSAGDFDHTKEILEELGMKTLFWKVAIKPGKPLLFGTFQGRIIFGVPGNPVAALVCAEEFIRPALETMQGRRPGHPSYHLLGTLENDYGKEAGRQQYMFCRVSEDGEEFRVHVIRPQGSAMMGMACRANALAIAPAGVKTLKKGTTVKFRWLK